jgi:hypothetical protein
MDLAWTPGAYFVSRSQPATIVRASKSSTSLMMSATVEYRQRRLNAQQSAQHRV